MKNLDREEMLSRLAGMTDDEVLRRAEDDPDCRPLSEEQLSHMVSLHGVPGVTLRERMHNAMKRQVKQSVTFRCDADVLEWYRSKGKGYQSLMNAALRACMEAEMEGDHVLNSGRRPPRASA